MSYRIERAKQLRSDILNLEKELSLNEKALSSVESAKGSRSSIEEFRSKETKLRKKLVKAEKKYKKYTDENLKISELPKVIGGEDEEDLDEYYYEED